MKSRPTLRAALALVGAAVLAACSDQALLLPRAQGPSLTVIPTTAFASMDAGGNHSCALTSAGQGWCWGRNSFGQLGDSTAANSNVPVAVLHPAGVTFTQISVGSAQTCAITGAGQAWCWGHNADGRLGDSTTTVPLMPVAVKQGALSFTSVTTGGAHSCALNGSGQAYCWGTNANGQIGDSTTVSPWTPVAVKQPAGVTFTSITVGDRHSCALASTGQAYCWGYGGDGALGTNSTLSVRIPTAVQQPVGVTFSSIATEHNHTCALDSAGQAYCWGQNFNGQVGDGTTTSPRKVPVAVSQPLGVTFASISTGGTHSCGVDASGQAYCWGANSRGQIGDATTTQRLTPVAVSQPSGVALSSVRQGVQHTCGLDGVGQTWCWGYNLYGQVGDATNTNRSIPTAVSH